MEASQFDTLALRVARLTRRRAISRLVLGLPALVVALIGGGLDPTSVEAADDPARILRRRHEQTVRRRRRRRTRHKHRKNRVRRNKKHKQHNTHKTRKSTSTCTPRTCPANGCGSLADGCGGTLQCGGCGTNHLCVDGTCRTCDVCQTVGACAFTSVQAAIDATDPQLETIVVCPGTYVEDAGGEIAIYIERSLRLVGAGDGDDPDTNTILKPLHSGQTVVAIHPGTQGTPQVTLERVQITGGFGDGGTGLASVNVVVDLIDCTITGNDYGSSSSAVPGGIFAHNTTLTLTDTRITGNAGNQVGGMLVSGNSQVTFDTLSRVTGNTATGFFVGTGFGGIAAGPDAGVTLPSAANVSGNFSTPAELPDCGGAGKFIGPGAVCTTTT